MTALDRQIDPVHKSLQPLPGMISDTMARDDHSLYPELARISETLTAAMERATQLAAECRTKSAKRQELTSR